MNLTWVNDPTTKTPSVSLTLLVVFGVFALAGNVCKAFDYISDIASLNELFYSSVALYFSRRNLMFNGKKYSANKAEEVKESITE